MGWASLYIEKLKAGETVSFRPKGNSMQPMIMSGQLCTVEPLGPDSLIEVDAIVLCKIQGKEYLHLVKSIRHGLYEIGNNRGHINGWISLKSIYGRCVRVEP